jgi:hypothetical protein
MQSTSHTSSFQASTISTLFDGSYDGDLSFAELHQHGDLGLGTLKTVWMARWSASRVASSAPTPLARST